MLSRMKYIYRWGLMRNTRQESLSEHSLEVAYIAHALTVIRNRRLGGNLSAEHSAVLAMFHDASEIITGDLPTPVKYYNDEIRTAYKQMESVAGNQILRMMPEDLQPDFALYFSGDNDIKSAEDAEYEKIVKAADKLSAYIKCMEEEKMGNSEFSMAMHSTEESLGKMELPEVRIFMDEFIGSFRLTLDEQKTMSSD